MSEVSETQRLDCVCGKKLRIPANVSSTAKAGKCPKCQAPFEYRDGTWFCVASDVDISAISLVSPKPNILPTNKLVKLSEYTVAKNASLTDGQASEPVIADQYQPPIGSPDRSHLPIVVSASPLSRVFAELVTTQFTDGDSGTPFYIARTEGDANSNLCGESENVGIHEAIRDSLALALGLTSRYPKTVVSAITLACHPWPDSAISRSEIATIAAEMCPGLNIAHPSMCEIAIDRLLRLADAMRFQDAKELELLFANAAATIESYAAEVPGMRLGREFECSNIALVQSPIGIGVQTLGVEKKKFSNSPATKPNFWRTTILAFLSSSALRGSRDTGGAIGGEKTGVSIEQLARHLGVELPECEFDAYINRLDDRVLDIFRCRTFRIGIPDTLEEIASRWNITRERVRQIEVKASERLKRQFGETLKGIGKQAFVSLTHYVVRKNLFHEITLAIVKQSSHREILTGFLAEVFGPWQTAGAWLYHKSLEESVCTLRNLSIERADSYGVLDRDTLESHCEELFLSHTDRDDFLREELGLGNYFGIWTNKNTLRCQVAAALRHVGRSSTKEEIADLIGHPAECVGSILANLDGVVRADRYRWGFHGWIDDVYDGIVGEIEQRIDAYSGSVPIHILLSEIPSQFNVAEGSVRAYLASTAFKVENGIVRRAGIEEYTPRNPENCRDAVRIGDRWAYRSLVHQRHFNGYSLGVNFDVAYANGLRPGDNLVVSIDGCESHASLIWRPHNLNRLVDVGRISEFLLTQGYKAGDTVFLIPSREGIAIVDEQKLFKDYGELKSLPSTSIDDEDCTRNREDLKLEVNDPLLDLLGEF
ncbi:sigma factor-like helix-turn-helix DNA-binding protein [Aureliella helgolandensis]|uniref:RNA polymerase factor sigma-32 n=1 Tax=Aureliella helgolandensis TaxID=2527968 RepID=A0A518G7R9_9BACT|nr:sigma factor-like helix-turn-helix DNA-binding protein [Aureliella helgolandensis]QDV24628.1 RNA polymerase factor sigma-32 [Aureliella helgolandensis]